MVINNDSDAVALFRGGATDSSSKAWTWLERIGPIGWSFQLPRYFGASLIGRSGLTYHSVMPSKKSAEQEHLQLHKDGSIWARGKTREGLPTGYWEWFRKDGTKLRSGFFEKGTQTGDWTTYDQQGRVYKVTAMKPKKAKGSTAPRPGKSGAT